MSVPLMVVLLVIINKRGDGKRFLSKRYPNFLKILTERAVTTEAGSLVRYFTTLNERAGTLLRQ